MILFISFAYLIILPLERFKTSIENDERLNVIGSLECKHLAESYNEIYDLKAQNEKSLLKKAEYDSLTGILNRRAFDQICHSSSEKKQQIALLLIDMANSSQGHPIYDLMSVYLADYINSEREPGFFNRTGLTREQVKDEWEVFKMTYLDTSDPDTLDAFQNAVSFYGELRWLIYLKRLPDDNPMKAEGIDRACKDFFPSVEDKIRTTGVWFKKAFA